MDSENSDVSDFEVVDKDLPSVSDPSLAMDPLAPPAPLPDFVVFGDAKPEADLKDVPQKEDPSSKPAKPSAEAVESAKTSLHADQRNITEIGGLTIVEEEEKNEPSMSSIFSWVKSAIPVPTALQGKELIDRISEKAKSTMDSVITTLDPQMKEIINSGGDCEMIVTSLNEDKVGGVREAFQDVFGKATVRGLKSQCNSVAPQPVGLISATQAAIEKEAYLRSSGLVHHQQAIISVESFLLEISKDKWYILNLLYLSDPNRNLTLQTLSQPIEVPFDVLERCQGSNDSSFTLGKTGFAMTVGHAAAQELGCAPSEWYREVCGVRKRELIATAARTLAYMYKKAISRL